MAPRIGKFSSDTDATLYFLCQSEWANESTGDIPEFGRYVWRISNDPFDVHIPNTEITSLLEDFLKEEEIADSAEFRASLVGHFLVSENSDGLVTVQEFPSETALIAAFKVWQDMYDRFFDGSETEA